MNDKIFNNYFLILFSLLPISILIGPSVSLINIIIIDLSFLIFLLYIKDFSFLKNKTVRYFLILYLYLIFNSIISFNSELGIFRNLGFIRIIIFFVALNYFFNQKFFCKRLITIWLFIISIVVFDVYFEKINGTNLLGFPKTDDNSLSYGARLVSFFKDEPIVGGFINAFLLIIIGFLFQKIRKENNLTFFNRISFILTLAVFFVAIFITGERANTIKAFLGIFFFISLIKEIDIKIRIISISLILISLIVIISNSEYFKLRYTKQIMKAININVEEDGKPTESQYLKIYKSGLQVFKNYPIFGVGNKNYRYETCQNPNNKNENKINDYLCITHPHQIYIEFLSEHGLVGTFILLFILYKLIFSKIIYIIKYGNYIQLGSFLYLTNLFLPLIPSGSFFNDYSLTLFGINIAILYASNSNLNIFSNKSYKIEY